MFARTAMVASAVLGIFCFPPFSFWPLAYFVLVPFLYGSASLEPRQALKWGYAAGFLFYSGLVYWLGFNSGAPPFLAWTSCFAVVAILATVWSITGWAVSRVRRSHGPVWAAVVFVALYLFFEVFWGTGELGFPWPIWALSQTTFLAAIQIAEFGDVYLISLWILSLNALCFLTFLGIRVGWTGALFVLLMILIPVYGAARLFGFQRGPGIPVAAIQANTPVDEKWDQGPEEILDDYIGLTETLADSEVTLVVWPETATPMPLRFRDEARRKVQSLTDSTGICLITGATDYDVAPGKDVAHYNSAFVIRPLERDLWSAAKVHLVPFGERVPGQKWLPFLGKIRLGQAEFAAAESPSVFPGWRDIPPLGCLICFEVVFPEVAGDLVRGGAMLLANLTEDGWYGRSSEQSQHLELTKLRAVAVRRGVIRAANLGIPALILPTGEFAGKLPLDRRGSIQSFLPLQSEITLAARLCRVWLPLYSGILALVLIGLVIRTRIVVRK